MKIVGSISLLLCIFCGIQHACSQNVTAMSYNIRMDTPNDGDNQWKFRKVEVVGLIQNYKPDFFGLQEAMFHQRNYVDSCMPHYQQIGVGREDGKNKGEATPIFYNTKKYTLIQHSTFWLSETPGNVSLGWDAACNRTCTYGQFVNKKNGQKVWVFNTHFDHKGDTARFNAAELILSKISQLAKDEPIILTGDFNATEESKPYKILTRTLNDAMYGSSHLNGPAGTWNGFNKSSNLDRRIDYIFVHRFKVESFSHVADRRKNGLWVSDHLPVFVQLIPSDL